MAHERITNEGVPVGPYCGRSSLPRTQWDELRSMGYAHSNLSHRNPREDPRLEYIAGWEHCAFISRAALLDWFDGYTEMLNRHGFRIHTYYVPMKSVRIGMFAGQVLYPRRNAISLSVEPLVDNHPGTPGATKEVAA
ncbi:hypothetical protein [Streptomyces malaysiensis]